MGEYQFNEEYNWSPPKDEPLNKQALWHEWIMEINDSDFSSNDGHSPFADQHESPNNSYILPN